MLLQRTRFASRVVETTAHAIDKRMKRVRWALAVLAQIDAARTHRWQRCLHSCDLLVRLMATIVYQHVDPRDLAKKPPPEGRVALIPDMYVDPVTGVRTAGWLYIDSVDVCAGAEVLKPHRQASAAVNPNFHNGDLTPDKPSEMPLVNREVVQPFPKPRPLSVLVEVLAEADRARALESACSRGRGQALGESPTFPESAQVYRRSAAPST
jgi:hypothetical protein